MSFYLYQDKSTFFHKLDSRIKLAILFASFFVFVALDDISYLLIFLGVVLIQGLISKVLGNLKRIWFILFMTGFFSMVLWSLTAADPLYGAIVALKVDGMIIAGLFFLSTTRNEEIFLGLIRLKVPYRVAFVFQMSLRLIPTFMGTVRTVVEAQKSRGLDLETGSPIARLKKHIPLLAPIFLLTIRNSDQLAMALESKGWGKTV